MLLGLVSWCQGCEAALSAALPAHRAADGRVSSHAPGPDGASPVAGGRPAPELDPLTASLLGLIATGRHLRDQVAAAAPVPASAGAGGEAERPGPPRRVVGMLR